MSIPSPSGRTEISREVIDWVERLHGVVDELVAPIASAHGARLTCRAGCHDCCSDALSVFEIEAAVIDGADLDPQAALAGVHRPAPETGHAEEAHPLDLYQSIVRPSPSANETPAV